MSLTYLLFQMKTVKEFVLSCTANDLFCFIVFQDRASTQLEKKKEQKIQSWWEILDYGLYLMVPNKEKMGRAKGQKKEDLFAHIALPSFEACG